MKTCGGFLLGTFLLSICLFPGIAFAQADCLNAPITFSPGSQNQNFIKSGGSGNLGVIMQSDCQWHPVTNTSFLHLGQFVGLGQGNATFTVDANPNLASRSGTIAIFGNTSNTNATATITQDAATGSFTLAVNPGAQIVTAGGNTSYTVTITRSGGFVGAVGLEVNGLPVNTTRSFNPNNTTGNSSTMTLTTATSTPGGTYPMTIKGVNGNVTATVSARLTVNPVPTPTPTPSTAYPGSGSTQLSSFLDATGVTTGAPAGQSIFYRATDQHIHHIFSNTAWFTDDPTAATEAPAAVSGTSISSFLDVTGASTGRPAGQSIFYFAANQHVQHIFSNTARFADDPTAGAGAPLAATGSAITSFLDAAGKTLGDVPGQSVFYIGTDQHVHHLFSDVSWHQDDPTAGSGAPLAAVGSSLSSFFDPTGATTGGVPGQAIFFLGADQHVHHIFSDTTWHNDDPSVGSGAPLALAGSPLSSFVDPTGATTGRPSGQSSYY